MQRRTFMVLGGAAVGWPLIAPAQQKPMPVIGVLGLTTPTIDVVAANLSALRAGLREAGYTEGQNLRIEYRWAERDPERLPGLAADLVRQKVDVIVTEGGDATTQAAKNATPTIPIVFHGGDSVERGWVASFARPGGNLTGVNLMGGEVLPKLLELLLELVPQAHLIGLIRAPHATMNLPSAGGQRVQVQVVDAVTPSETDAAFASLVQMRVDGIVVFTLNRLRIAEAALRAGIPAIALYRDFTAAGGLICYGPSMTDAYRLKGQYTGRILKGEKPADLPVQQPTKFDLVINLKTAKALRLTVPQWLLQRADEVIE